jgi:hypothetical protein
MSLNDYGLEALPPCTINCRKCNEICKKHYSVTFSDGRTVSYGRCRKPSHGITIKKSE